MDEFLEAFLRVCLWNNKCHISMLQSSMLSIRKAEKTQRVASDHNPKVLTHGGGQGCKWRKLQQQYVKKPKLQKHATEPRLHITEVQRFNGVGSFLIKCSGVQQQRKAKTLVFFSTNNCLPFSFR